MYIQFLGAAGTVTGSKHLINTSTNPSGKDGFQVLIDCGLFQGPKEWRERNWQDTPVPAREIDAVILTHAHLDHSGWIPRLVKQGFTGPSTLRPRRWTCAPSCCPIPDTCRKKKPRSTTSTRSRSTRRRCRSTPWNRRSRCLTPLPDRGFRPDATAPPGTLVPLRACGAYFGLVAWSRSRLRLERQHAAPALHRRHRPRARQRHRARQGGALRAAGRRKRRPAGDGDPPTAIASIRTTIRGRNSPS